MVSKRVRNNASLTVVDRIKASLPWYVKVSAKILMSRLPIGFNTWRRMGLFRHGAMDRPEYLLTVVRSHLQRIGWPGSLKHGFVALELGPGDSVASGMIASAAGASRTYLVDTGDFATQDMRIYREQAKYLRAQGISPLVLPDEMTFDEFLGSLNIKYLTSGLQSLRTIPDRSVDFIWSQAVLEHIRQKDFAPTIAELRRILASGGVCSHRVDLSDHLGGALNNLRFSSRVWESEFMASSGFYTNRIRFSEMINIFKRHDFSVTVVNKESWDLLPTPRATMSGWFRSWQEDDLIVRGFDILLT